MNRRAWIRFAVAYASGLVDEVELCCEDSTRSEPDFVARVCAAAVEQGATTINLPDTVGFCLPDEYAAFITQVRSRCPELEDVTLSAHCHDDLGLAVANTLAGVAAGASQVECTVNGIGERAGNAALEEVVMALRVKRDLLHATTGIATTEALKILLKSETISRAMFWMDVWENTSERLELPRQPDCPACG